jgi:hypothetical protein
MTRITLAIPEDLHPHEGDEVLFQTLVQADGSYLVTRAVRSQPRQRSMTPADWARKWAGSMKLEEGETRESLRDAYMKEKFGA